MLVLVAKLLLFLLSQSACTLHLALTREMKLLLPLIAAVFAAEPMPLDEFKEQAVPITRKFIFSKYARFAASELTFRHLKTHLAEKLGMTYDMLKADEYSSVVEDVTDEIANECNMGELDIVECKRRIGYEEPVAKDET